MSTMLPKVGCCLLITCILAGCARREAEETEGTQTSAENATDSTFIAPPPPPAKLSSVQLQLTLTPEAEHALAQANEGVLVDVTYAGDPAPNASVALNELGLVEIGKVTYELDGSGTLSLDKESLDDSRLTQIDGQPQLLVNATSSHRNSSLNLLSCPFYWDTLSVASGEGVHIACDIPR